MLLQEPYPPMALAVASIAVCQRSSREKSKASV